MSVLNLSNLSVLLLFALASYPAQANDLCAKLFPDEKISTTIISSRSEFIKEGFASEWHDLKETILVSVKQGEKSDEGKTEVSIFLSNNFLKNDKNSFQGGALPTVMNFKFDKVTSKRRVHNSSKIVFSNSDYELEIITFFSSIERLTITKKGWLLSKLILHINGNFYSGDHQHKLYMRKPIQFTRVTIPGSAAKELFDFLVSEAGAPSLEFEHNYRGLLVIEDMNNPGQYKIDFRNIKFRSQLLDVQQGLKELGFNLKHPIFTR